MKIDILTSGKSKYLGLAKKNIQTNLEFGSVIRDNPRQKLWCYCIWGTDSDLNQFLEYFDNNLKTIKKNISKILFYILIKKYNKKPNIDYNNILDLELK